METLRKLENLFRCRWHGITFLDEEKKISEGTEIRRVSRFCEALDIALTQKMVIRTRHFTCPGACFSFGCMVDLKAMTEKLIEQKGYPQEQVERLIENSPHFQKMPEMIGFNWGDEPDVYISRLQPAQVMLLLQTYHIKNGGAYRTEILSILSACANTTVRAFQNQDLAISFGCDDSRTFGNLSRDRLYAALPYSLARKLIQ